MALYLCMMDRKKGDSTPDISGVWISYDMNEEGAIWHINRVLKGHISTGNADLFLTDGDYDYGDVLDMLRKDSPAADDRLKCAWVGVNKEQAYTALRKIPHFQNMLASH